MTPYRPGDHVVLREVWKGKVWTLRPATVVRDTPGLVALLISDGTSWRPAQTLDGRPLRLPKEPWRLGNGVLRHNHLRLSPPGAAYAVIAIFDAAWQLRLWYINLEEPLRRSPAGFDYMDQALDVLIPPDLSSWAWKDEDELEEAVLLGIYSRAEAGRIRAEGERALERLLERRPPLDEPWEDWRPDPAWALPRLPETLEAAAQS